MSKLYLNAQSRDAVGSNGSNQLRKNGFIPGILYGVHMTPQPVKLDQKEFDKFIASNYVGSKVYVKIDGKEIMALVKEVQKDVFGEVALHVDLQALSKKDKVKLRVRLNFTGKDNLPVDLMSQELVNELEIETLPEFLIDSISVDVSHLTFGEVVKVADLPIMNDANIKVLSDPNLTLISLSYRSHLPAESTPAVAEQQA